MEGSQTVRAIEASLVQYVDKKVHESEARPTFTYDLFQQTDEQPVNNLMFRVPVKNRHNGNVGGGSVDGTTTFRLPGSPKEVAMLFQAVERHISGGVNQNTLDNWARSNSSMGGNLARRIQDDFMDLSKDRNRGLHRGNNGARGTVNTANGAVTLASGETSMGLDDYYGTKHLEEETYYEIYEPVAGTRRGISGGYQLLRKEPSTKLVYFSGDLTGLGIVTSDVIVPPTLFNADCDGLPEMFGDSGFYAGRDRDEEWQFRAQKINASSGLVGLAILERLDARMKFVSGDYDGSRCAVVTTPNLEAQYKELGWAQTGPQEAGGTFRAGFKDVKYKDMRMIVDPDGDPRRWYRTRLDCIRRYTLKPRGLFGKQEGQHLFVQRSGSQIVDAWEWKVEEKTNLGTHKPRWLGYIYGFDPGTEVGHA